MPTGQTEAKRKETIDNISKTEDLADQSLAPTPVSEWGKKRKQVDDGFILELPSGNVCKIRRTMDMMTLLQAGKIPNPLARTVNQMIDSGSPNIGKFLQEAESPEVVRQMFDLVNRTMAKIFVEPSVSCPEPRSSDEDWDAYMERVNVWRPDEGTLSVFDIEMEDKMYAFAVAQGAPADLERFREESESAVESVQASPRVVEKTKRTGGTRSKK